MLRYPFDGNYPVTQKFGANPSYYQQFGFAGHEGQDWGTPNGTPILACEAGKIVRRNDVKDGAYGIYVVVWHESLKLATWYCHLQQNIVTTGQEVTKGQKIGLSDNTGNTTGPHLHLNLCKTDENGYRTDMNNGYKGFIDPAPYIEAPQPSHDPIVCQAEKDQIRLERDRNWNLYKTEEQAKEELMRQLDATKHELEQIRVAIREYADTLGCPATSEAVSAKIRELIAIEDEYIKLQKLAKDQESEIKTLQEQNQRKKDENDILMTKNSDLTKELATCKTNGELCEVKLKKATSPCEKKSARELLALALAKLWRKDKNGNT